ncbi:Flp family type IVb pilin [Tianweitania sp.]|uniref:Flp family type IVb pilin n=1 Tax=Tianweitania sp. TaxID=2021634 RepID=UPI00289B02CE|nr:Flp family type IVb pilin [Tianweitania sp.]
MIRRFIRDERGATMVEYGLIVACLALAVLVGFGNATNALTYLWGNNNSRLIQALDADQ